MTNSDSVHVQTLLIQINSGGMFIEFEAEDSRGNGCKINSTATSLRYGNLDGSLSLILGHFKPWLLTTAKADQVWLTKGFVSLIEVIPNRAIIKGDLNTIVLPLSGIGEVIRGNQTHRFATDYKRAWKQLEIPQISNELKLGVSF